MHGQHLHRKALFAGIDASVECEPWKVEWANPTLRGRA